jgi:hypothetical protein
MGPNGNEPDAALWWTGWKYDKISPFHNASGMIGWPNTVRSSSLMRMRSCCTGADI